MLNDEQIEDLLFAIHSLLEGSGLTPHGIKKYKYLEQELLSIKRMPHLTPLAVDGLELHETFEQNFMRRPTKRAPDVAKAEGFCECDTPDFAPFIECQNCGKPPRG